MARSKRLEKYQKEPFKELSSDRELVIAFLPIKPKYANRILDGSKKFEFRKSRFRKEITHIIIYSSSPIKKIVGIAEVGNVKEKPPSSLWEQTKHGAGISRNAFRKYFSGVETAFAISLSKVVRLANELTPKEIWEDFRIPQSFAYVDSNFYSRVVMAGLRGNAG